MTRGTQIIIKIKPEKIQGIKDAICDDEGYHKSNDIGADGEYRKVIIIFTRYFGYFEKKDFGRLVGDFGGEIVRIRRLDRRQFMSEKVKIMLRDASLVSAVTFFTSLGASKAVTSIDYYSMLTIAVIPTLTSFFAKLSLDLKIKFPSAEKSEGE